MMKISFAWYAPFLVSAFTFAATNAAANPSEVDRIQSHLDGALELVRSRDVSKLSPDQLRRRNAAIARLVAYRDAGVFPKNRDFPNKRMPYFVDADGTRCAMAHLIEASGDADLMTAVANTRNNAFVRELADEPALVEWLNTNGLSVEEAARIQPSYGCFAPAECVCGGFNGHASGSLRVGWTVTATGTQLLVKETYGQTPGYAVGDALETFGATGTDGDQMFVGITLHDAQTASTFSMLAIDADDSVECQAGFDKIKVSAQVALEAAAADDCVRRLGAIDGRLSDDSHCDEGGGCNTARPSSAWFASLLLVLLGVGAIRRL